MPKELCAAVAICLSLAAGTSYLYGVLRGRSKPHTISWFIWLVLMLVAFLGQRKEGSGPGSWPLLVGTVTSGCIFCVALRRGETSISVFDVACLVLAIAAFVLYCQVNDTLYSMTLATAVDCIGYFPTVRKVLRDPSGEERIPWLCYTASPLMTLTAIRSYSVVTVMYPAMTATMNIAVLAILTTKSKVRPAASL